jgi:hypothetical protein
MTQQLRLPSFEETTWEVLGRPPTRRHVRADGAGRLLLELQRRGLREEHLHAAARLVLELDRQTAPTNKEVRDERR